MVSVPTWQVNELPPRAVNHLYPSAPVGGVQLVQFVSLASAMELPKSPNAEINTARRMIRCLIMSSSIDIPH